MRCRVNQTPNDACPAQAAPELLPLSEWCDVVWERLSYDEKYVTVLVAILKGTLVKIDHELAHDPDAPGYRVRGEQFDVLQRRRALVVSALQEQTAWLHACRDAKAAFHAARWNH